MEKNLVIVGPTAEDRGNFFGDLRAFCEKHGYGSTRLDPTTKIIDVDQFNAALRSAAGVFCIVDRESADFFRLDYWANMIEKAGIKYPVQIMFDLGSFADPEEIVELAGAYSDAILYETRDLEVTNRHFKKVFYDQKTGRSCSTENDFSYLPGMEAIAAAL